MSKRWPGSLLSTAAPATAPAKGLWTAQQQFIQTGRNSWNPLPLLGPLSLAGVSGASGPAYPGTQSQYAALATIPTEANYFFADGYHYFDITPGTYNVRIKGAEGSGTQHGYGADINATMTVVELTRMVALIGNAGSGSYGGGGGTFLAITTGNTYASASAVLVAGGGGGGYTNFSALADGGDTNWTSTIRRGGATTSDYDGGAAFSNVYNPEIYNTTLGGQGSVSAQHFVWGGRGGIQTACGSGAANQGGFGGGGGSCPAGGGGFYGGKAGGNNPSGTPGGGGTSYRLASGSVAFIPSWSDIGTNGTSRTATTGLKFGSIAITPQV